MLGAFQKTEVEPDVSRCEEAARHGVEMDEALAMVRKTVGIERETWERAVSHGLAATHTSLKAHELGKCSCFVRALVEAEQMDRAFGPRYKW